MNILNKKRYMILTIIAVIIVGIVAMILGDFFTINDANNIHNKTVALNTANSIDVIKIGSYDGPYIEDGSDKDVSDIMMIQVKNNGNKAVQYAEITLSGPNQDNAIFKLSTLNPGEVVTVLETNMKKYDKKDEYTEAVSSNVVLFESKLNTYKDKIKIEPLDGGLNVTNISNEDINGEIVIYFKDCDGDMLMGGITYRGRIEGGIKTGEICQLMSSNFSKSNTKVMFVTIDGK